MRRIDSGTGGYFRRRAVLFLFLTVVFAMGAVAGAVAVRTLDPTQKSELMSYLQNVFQTFTAGPAVSSEAVFRQALVDNVGKTVGVMWLLGLSILGVPLVLVLLFLRGFVLGFSAAFLVEQMVYRGAFLVAAAIAPHNLLIIPALILAAGASASFSLAALRTLFGRRRENMYHQFLSTTLLCLAAALILAAAALVEGYVTPALIEVAGRYIF